MTPLEGLRILDLSRLLPGPFCTLLLADLGAEVVKVEDPVQGDYMRWLPPYQGKEGAAFLSLNRNKKSIKLNLKSEKGKDIFLKLVEKYDVVLESFRPGVMEKLGLGYDVASARNQRIIYCSISGYGQDGVYRDKPGHDLNYIGYAGVLGLTGQVDGAPVIPGVQIADIGGGALMAAVGILAAAAARERTGRGQWVDVAMLDGTIAWVAHLAAVFFAGHPPPTRGTHLLNGASPSYSVFETKDGRYITLANIEPKFWEELCRLLNREDLKNRLFDEGEDKGKLFAVMKEIFRTKTLDEWLKFFEGKDVCVGPAYDLNEVFVDPHILSREMLVEVEHPSLGAIRQVGIPLKFSRTPGEIRTPPPGFGEHTEEILKEIGIGDEEMAKLKEENVI
ncbi:MAG: CaiB/BaiF CoA-transferase family protein [bacterium]